MKEKQGRKSAKRFKNPDRTVIALYLSDAGVILKLPQSVIENADFIIDSRAKIKLSPDQIIELLNQENLIRKDR